MNEYEQQKTKGKKAKKGKFLLWTGLLITLTAVILLIVGFMTDVIYTVIGGFALVIGIAATIYGLQLAKQGKGINIGITTVKCRKCGYLERAGAEFCSNCAQKL